MVVVLVLPVADDDLRVQQRVEAVDVEALVASAGHREGIDATKNPTGRASYETFLRGDREATRQALVGIDAMEARARRSAEGAILAAAQLHEYTATGATPTISTIQDAKTYFGVK